MCPTERIGRDEHSVGPNVLPHITPSLSNHASAPYQVDRPRYLADGGQLMGCRRGRGHILVLVDRVARVLLERN